LTLPQYRSFEASVFGKGDGHASVQNVMSIREFVEGRRALSEQSMDRASSAILEGVTAILLIALWCAPLATAAFAAYKYATPDRTLYYR
jgi:hypothetical protein